MAKPFLHLDNDSRLGVIVGNLLALMALNILWVLCCIPLVTVGASTTALHSGIRCYVNREGGATKVFLASFRKNFVLSTLVWLPALGLAGCILLCFRIVSLFQGTARLVGIGFFCVPALLLAVILSYAFPLIARYELKWKDVVLNSVMIAIAFFPRTLLILGLNALPVLLFILAPSAMSAMIFIWVPIGFSVTALTITGSLDKIFFQLENNSFHE